MPPFWYRWLRERLGWWFVHWWSCHALRFRAERVAVVGTQRPLAVAAAWPSPAAPPPSTAARSCYVGRWLKAIVGPPGDLVQFLAAERNKDCEMVQNRLKLLKTVLLVVYGRGWIALVSSSGYCRTPQWADRCKQDDDIEEHV